MAIMEKIVEIEKNVQKSFSDVQRDLVGLQGMDDKQKTEIKDIKKKFLSYSDKKQVENKFKDIQADIKKLAEKTEVRKIVKNSQKKSGLTRLLKLFRKYNSIELSLKKAEALIHDAKQELSVFPDTPAKESLFTIADYTLRRGK